MTRLSLERPPHFLSPPEGERGLPCFLRLGEREDSTFPVPCGERIKVRVKTGTKGVN